MFQSVSGSAYTGSIFSDNAEEERKLSAYFLWLGDNFNNLTASQKNDFNVLKVRQNFSILKNKPAAELTQAERDFLNKYGVTPTSSNSPTAMDRYMSQVNDSSANINFVTSKEDLPMPITSNVQGPTATTMKKVGKEMGFKKGQDVYQYKDFTTGQTSYYYVVKDIKRFEASGGTTANILTRYQKISEIVAPDPPRPKTINISGGGGGTTLATKTSPAKYVKLWYSADYKTLYEDEIKKQVLELLNVPDMVLSQYDWETIDSLSDTNGSVTREGDEIIYMDYQEPEVKVQSTIPPEVANLVYKIQENISPVHDSLNNYISTDVTILSNFGYHKTKKAELTKLYPAYRSGGEPRYDLEVEFIDIDGVSGYTIYLVEEDGII